MVNVWLVQGEGLGDTWIEGVFSTRDKAYDHIRHNSFNDNDRLWALELILK